MRSETKLRSYLEAQYKDLEMISIKYLQHELLITYREATILATGRMKDKTLKRKAFIDLVIQNCNSDCIE